MVSLISLLALFSVLSPASADSHVIGIPPVRGPSSAVYSATYYVSPTGNDSNPGTEAQPFKTVPKGINTAQEGDTVFIQAGTYDLNGFATTLDRTISLVGENNATTVLTASGVITVSAGLTVKNLTFSAYANPLFKPFADTGRRVDGFHILNCIFENGPGVIYDNSSAGVLTNISIRGSVFRNLTSSGALFTIRMSRAAELANVVIEDNVFLDLTSGPTSVNQAVLIGHPYVTDFTNVFHHISISRNRFDGITGGVGPVQGNVEVHAIMASGSYVTIANNVVRRLNEGPDHEAIYLKGSNSVISGNDVENGDGGGINDGNGADITIKGVVDGVASSIDNNVISGNRITSTLAKSGTGILTEGGVRITNNYIKKPGGTTGVFTTASQGTMLSIDNNYVETRGTALLIYLADRGEVANNVFISYGGEPIRLSDATHINIHDNRTCKGTACGSPLPANPSCQNVGNLCCAACQEGPYPGYDATCPESRVCCGSCLMTLPTPSEASTFADVPPSHPYYDEIEWLYRNGYTAGCATDPLRYCPDATMNRAESAVFVERGIHSASYDPATPSSQVFADLPLDSWAAKWVNGLWVDQYTAGCGTDPMMYCPWQGHTRAEGTVFYLRMMHGAEYVPAEATVQRFVDVPMGAWYAKWVEDAYNAGLITACESSPEMRFCPDDPLTRALAAHMMVKAKGLTPP